MSRGGCWSYWYLGADPGRRGRACPASRPGDAGSPQCRTGGGRVQRSARSFLLQVFRRVAEGKASRPATRASAVLTENKGDAGSHLAYWRPKSLVLSAKVPWSVGTVAPWAARRSAAALSSHELWARTLANNVRVPARVRARRRSRIAGTMSRHLAWRT